MRYAGWLLTLLVALLAADFAVCNQKDIDLDLWPLPDALTMPTYLVVLGAVSFGLIIGRISLWPKHQRLKFAHRRQARRLETLEAKHAANGEPAKPASSSLAA